MLTISPLKLRWLRMTGALPTTAQIEARRHALEGKYQRYKEFVGSEEYRRYQQLLQLRQEGQIDQARERVQLEQFRGSKEEGMLEDLKRLSRQKEVRLASRGKGDVNNPEYQRYQELVAATSRDEFKARVAYLKNKHRFETTEMGQAARELEQLSKSRELRWCKQQMDKEAFVDLVQREELLFDDFEGDSLDRARWSPRFFWADALLHHPYSLATDPHCYTDGKNVRVANGDLVIELRPEQAEGLAWDGAMGFVPHHFDYTSGLVCTGHSFRFQRGLLEAKIRFTWARGVYHALYLVGDRMLPQVDLFRSDPEREGVVNAVYSEGDMRGNGSFTPRVESDGVGRLPFASEYFIASLEWTETEMVWRLNGREYMRRTGSMPKEPLYLVIASGAVPGTELTHPVRLEVDWVRCLSERRG